MLLHIVADTPRWVFALFFLLLAFGLRQLRDRQVTPARLTAMPIAMATFSLYGVISDFGMQATTLVAWAAGALLVLLTLKKPPPQAAATDLIRVPGSVAPLALMMAIFALKYIVAVTLIMQPALRQDLLFTLAGAALYGLFAGRALRVAWPLLRVASRRSRAPTL